MTTQLEEEQAAAAKHKQVSRSLVFSVLVYMVNLTKRTSNYQEFQDKVVNFSILKSNKESHIHVSVYLSRFIVSMVLILALAFQVITILCSHVGA